MNETSYSLYKKNNTEEYHIFKGQFTNNDNTLCSKEASSICGEAILKESTLEKTCLTKERARIDCCLIGDEVCGTCVSHLYLTKRKS